MSTIAINGFGRVGRQVFKIALEKGIKVAFINDLTDSPTLAHLLKYDSVHGRFDAQIEATANGIMVNGVEYPIFAVKNPAELPSGKLNVDIMIESTGVFTTRDKMSLHIQAGAKKVLLTAPAKDQVDATIVMGVNDNILKATDQTVSCASCTTNCLAPLAFILEKEFGVKSGFMNTVHSYTNDQNLLDLPHKDLRRARAAAVNIVPSTTGAAKALSLVIPSLEGKLDGLALRVPTPDGSIVDFTAVLNRDVTADEINQAFLKYSKSAEMQKYLEYNIDPIVSRDIIHNSHSCIFDSTLTQVIGGNLVKVMGWYDNEWGYSNRVVDLASLMIK